MEINKLRNCGNGKIYFCSIIVILSLRGSEIQCLEYAHPHFEKWPHSFSGIDLYWRPPNFCPISVLFLHLVTLEPWPVTKCCLYAYERCPSLQFRISISPIGRFCLVFASRYWQQCFIHHPAEILLQWWHCGHYHLQILWGSAICGIFFLREVQHIVCCFQLSKISSLL